MVVFAVGAFLMLRPGAAAENETEDNTEAPQSARRAVALCSRGYSSHSGTP